MKPAFVWPEALVDDAARWIVARHNERLGRLLAEYLLSRALEARTPRDRMCLASWIGHPELAMAVSRIAYAHWTEWLPWWEEPTTPTADRRMFLLWMAIAIEDDLSNEGHEQ
jgi:hypothetical protein